MTSNEIERIRREAEAKYPFPVSNSYGSPYPKVFDKIPKELKPIAREREAYEAGATTEHLRYQPVVEALKEISKQRTIEEMGPEHQGHADFEGAYDWFIKQAREALQQLNQP